ncbi:hypothetical protein K440DRAFT_631512 [Wilcoxina mikolae CBS 423.85]|nr:hypothetical protein K440DRAFT_631512 [Wilcoxina mikolae CBS 423.85]
MVFYELCGFYISPTLYFIFLSLIVVPRLAIVYIPLSSPLSSFFFLNAGHKNPIFLFIFFMEEEEEGDVVHIWFGLV